MLRNRNLSDVVWRLPPLELLERMSRSSVLVGLISIAIGTVLGFIWVDRLTGQYWYYDPKYVITLFVLLLYAVYWQLSRTTAWRGARASRLCIFNFVIVVLSFTVVNLYLVAQSSILLVRRRETEGRETKLPRKDRASREWKSS